MVVRDRLGKELNVGDKVIWVDPDPEGRDLSRTWEIYDLTDEIAYISDEYGEAEVPPAELILYQTQKST